jgi:hypothetical protein
VGICGNLNGIRLHRSSTHPRMSVPAANKHGPSSLTEMRHSDPPSACAGRAVANCSPEVRIQIGAHWWLKRRAGTPTPTPSPDHNELQLPCKQSDICSVPIFVPSLAYSVISGTKHDEFGILGPIHRRLCVTAAVSLLSGL